MRRAYYDLQARGEVVASIGSALQPLAGYEALSEQNDPPVTTFKGIPVRLDATLPEDEMQLRAADGTVLARIVGIS